jgi:ribonuclease BN (tRNA processing enzyme)
MSTASRGFEVIVLGAGDTFSAVHRTSAVLLACDGFHLAIDCPDTYRGALRDAAQRSGRPLDLAAIDHVLITHVHGDHMNGLEGLAFFKHFVEHKRLRLVTSDDVRTVIWEQRLRASMERLWDETSFRALAFDDYFDHVPLAWDGAIEVGPFRVHARRTKHHVPTSALLVEANGATFGYSADTAFDPELIAWLSRADVVLHETNFGPAHTPYESLAALPAETRARIRLIHYPDSFDVEASAIPVVREGDVIAVEGRPFSTR